MVILFNNTVVVIYLKSYESAALKGGTLYGFAKNS
jgi:hypothetical protein